VQVITHIVWFSEMRCYYKTKLSDILAQYKIKQVEGENQDISRGKNFIGVKSDKNMYRPK